MRRNARQALIGRELVVPGTIGNMGPGFDTVSLAVSLYLRVRITAAHDDRRSRLVCRFLGERPIGSNRIARAFRGSRGADGPSLEVEVGSDIPQLAGLGSSAAATIAGLQLRELVHGRRAAADLLGEAAV